MSSARRQLRNSVSAKLFILAALEDGRRSNNMLQVRLASPTCTRNVLLRGGMSWEGILTSSFDLEDCLPLPLSFLCGAETVCHMFCLFMLTKSWSSTVWIDESFIKQHLLLSLHLTSQSGCFYMNYNQFGWDRKQKKSIQELMINKSFF